MDAPARWQAQDAILREARFNDTMGFYTKAARLARIARELGPLSVAHEAEAQRIEAKYERYHGRDKAA